VSFFGGKISYEMKRRIDYKSIRGITYAKTTDEFIIHGSDVEYDYNFFSSRKQTIMEIIAIQYKKEMNGVDLPFAESNEKVLTKFVTTKKDKKSNPHACNMPNTGIIYFTKKGGSGGEVTKPDPTNSILGSAKLEDFRVLKVIGRGSFGKVCLVEHKTDKKLFAMKSLKKDVLIDQDQVENTLLEKNILETLNYPFLVGLKYCFQNSERIYLVMPFLRYIFCLKEKRW